MSETPTFSVKELLINEIQALSAEQQADLLEYVRRLKSAEPLQQPAVLRENPTPRQHLRPHPAPPSDEPITERNIPSFSAPATATPQPKRSLQGFTRGLFDGFQNKAEGWLEGKGGQIDQRKLAVALERQLEEGLQHLMHETLAPNRYLIELHPQDFGRYASFVGRARQELAAHLCQIATARDYQLLGLMRVEIRENKEVAQGHWNISSQFQEDSENTLPFLQLAGQNRTFPLNQAVITLGRSRDTTICLADWDKNQTISRLHATIRQEGEVWVMYDGDGKQGSKWGTFINGVRLAQGGRKVLQTGDVIALGRLGSDGQTPVTLHYHPPTQQMGEGESA